MRVSLYARVSTHDQHTLPMQQEVMQAYVASRGWAVVKDVEDIGSGVTERPQRETLIQAVRRRELDVIVVWRLLEVSDLTVYVTDFASKQLELIELDNEQWLKVHLRSPPLRTWRFRVFPEQLSLLDLGASALILLVLKVV